MYIQLGTGKLGYKRPGHCSQIQYVITEPWTDNDADNPIFAFIFEFWQTAKLEHE